MSESLKILILEDNAVDEELIRRELDHSGLKFLSKCIKTKKHFIKQLNDFSPDLILADYSLPMFTGLEALEIVKENALNIPLIIVTGSINEETAAYCLTQGAADYVIKEHLARLPSAIEGALEKKKIAIERAQMLNALKQQNRFLNDILESMTHPFAVINADDYTIVKMNSTAKEMLDIKDGMCCYNTILCCDEPCGDANNCLLESVKVRKEATVFERSFQVKSDDIRYFEIYCFPIFNDETNVIQIIVYFVDITGRKKAEEQIKKSLREKEVLLKEVYHRVKNNLQVISSLINLQGQSFKDDNRVREIFLKNRNRVEAMALMHEKLYQAHDLTRIDFVKYIHDLTAYLLSSYDVSPDKVKLKIIVNDILLDIDTAIPCGLIINELVSNSLKYAFPEDRKGEINIALFAHENSVFNLVVGDNGIGFPPQFDLQTTNSLGLQLVRTLAHQLGGELIMDKGQGVVFRIIFTPAQETAADSLSQAPVKE